MLLSCMSISVMAAMGIHRLGNDAHVADAGLLDRVHDSGEGAKRNILVGTQINCLVLRIANLLLQACCDLVDVDGIVAKENFLRFVNTDYQALWGDLFDGSGLGHVDFDPGLQHRGGHHENDEQHQDNIHEGRDVDIAQRRLRASVSRSETPQGRVSAICGGCWRSTRLSISSVKSSLREAISRMEPMMRL